MTASRGRGIQITSAWLCRTGCHRNKSATRSACRFCCGFTTDIRKHFTGQPRAAATTN